MVHQTHAVGVLSGDLVAGEDELFGAALAHQAGQALGAAEAGQNA